MAISYPLQLPSTDPVTQTAIGPASITLIAKNAVSVTTSPFTFRQQIFKHPGEAWEASVSLPPMRREDAEPWVAFLVSLKGQFGTFLMGDPNGRTPRGSAATSPGTPVVDGAGQTGSELDIRGLPPSAIWYFREGDYLQLGSGSTATLHKVLRTRNVTVGGLISNLDIWPAIRTAPADGAAITVSNCVGRWRLKENISQWQINNISSYGITFDCIEAL